MIKIFRKIRARLIQENRFSRYLLYAIGEIVLVVLGILIALKINDWNEQQKRDLLEMEYYCRLKEDAIQDSIKVENLIGADKRRLAASNQAARLLQKSKSRKNDVGKQFSLSLEGTFSTFIPNNAAFEDLKSGANLNIIKDKRVINALNNYFNNIKGFTDIIAVHSQLMVNSQYAYNDKLATGWVHGKLNSSRFIKGMDEDVANGLKIDEHEYLADDVMYLLYNDALMHISSNSRKIEILMLIKEEIRILLNVLENKCDA